MCGIRSCGGREMEKNKLLTLIFCSFFDNWQKFDKGGNFSKKKWGSPFKTTKILAKLPFWSKVLYLQGSK